MKQFHFSSGITLINIQYQLAQLTVKLELNLCHVKTGLPFRGLTDVHSSTTLTDNVLSCVWEYGKLIFQKFGRDRILGYGA